MTSYWGPLYWYFFHSVLNTYPDEPTNIDKEVFGNGILLFVKLVPCSSCRHHFTLILKSTPVKLANRSELRKWGINVHNKVNIRLKKNIYSASNYDNDYKVINHQKIFLFINYVRQQAYLNNIPFHYLTDLLHLLVLLYPCRKCRNYYQRRYKEDNLPGIMLSRIGLAKWMKSFFRPKGFHKPKDQKHKKSKDQQNQLKHKLHPQQVSPIIILR